MENHGAKNAAVDHKKSIGLGTNETPPVNKKIKFIVSGFGPFQNSNENPTTVIANRLIKYLENREVGNDSTPQLSAIIKTLVIETSVDAAREEIDRLYEQHIKDSLDQTTVFLHLGVSNTASCFRLEQCAYNDATFRIPDERGYQPRNKIIAENVAYQHSLSTDLDTAHLKLQLNRTCPNLPVEISTNPGRFVCNYTYFYSLLKTQIHGQSLQALFFHVPPFAVIGEDEQLLVVATLVQGIYSQINSRL